MKSQQLIYLKSTKIDPNKKERSFQWHLSPSPDEENPPIDIDTQWERLLSGEHPARTMTTVKEGIAGREKAMKEAKYADRSLARPERKIWEWEGRQPELTTRLQRLHLNRRNQRARPKEERKEMRVRKRLEAMEQEAWGVAERELLQQ